MRGWQGSMSQWGWGLRPGPDWSKNFQDMVHDHVAVVSESSPESKLKEAREATFLISCFKNNKNINE